MAWKLTIDSIDKTSSIDQASGVRLEFALNERARATFRTTFSSAYIPDRFAEVVIYAQDGTTPLFGGVVLEREIAGVTPQAVPYMATVVCVDFFTYFDWAIVSLSYTEDVTLKEVLEDLVDALPGSYSITLDAGQVDGPTLAPFSVENATITEVIRQIATSTGYVATISAAKALRMILPGAEAAPYETTSATPHVQSFDWSDSDKVPANKVVLVCGPTGTARATQRWTSVDGTETAFVTDIAAANDAPLGVATINPDTDNFAATVSLVGEGGMFEWDRATHTLTVGTLASFFTLEGGDVIVYDYEKLLPFTVVSGGDDEPVIAQVFTAPEITDLAPAQEMAAGKLAQLNQQPRQATAESLEHGWQPGQSWLVDLEDDRAVDAAFLITDVEIELISDGYWIYRLRATEQIEDAAAFQGSDLDRWRELGVGGTPVGPVALLGGGGGSGGGPALPSVSAGDLLVGVSTDVLDTIAAAAAGRYLRAAGLSTPAVWSDLILPNETSKGSLLVATDADTIGELSAGTSGYYLKAAGAATVPAWTAPAAFTKTDDTNVTATLGGSHATALLNAMSLTLGWTGQLAAGRGGFGIDTSSSSGIPSVNAGTWAINNVLTAGRVLFAGASNTIASDSDLTFATDTLTATKLVAPTSISTPSIITASGALTVTPAAGSNLAIALSTTGDLVVNTNQVYVDTSAAGVGFGTTTPNRRIEAVNSVDSVYTSSLAASTPTGTVLRLANLLPFETATGIQGAFLEFVVNQSGAGGNSTQYGTFGAITTGEVGTSFRGAHFVWGQRTGGATWAEAMRLTTGGQLGIGVDSPLSRIDAGISTGAGLTLRRIDTSVTANDRVGFIQFYAADSSTTTNFIVANIEAQATNTISTDINPGRLIFRTTPTDVAATPVEVLRLTELQRVGIGTGAASVTTAAKLHVLATTEQIRAAYDGSNYLSITVGSDGATTIDATGSGAAITFSDAVTGSVSIASPIVNATTGVRINGAASSGTVLRGDGTNYVASTATFANTYTASNLLYASSANTVTGLATANNSVLVTNGSGVPSLATDIHAAVTIGGAYVYRVGGTDVSVSDGGTGASSLTSNGVLYGNGTGAVQATAQGGTNTVLVANGGAPSFSAAITVGTSVTSPVIVATTSVDTPSILSALSGLTTITPTIASPDFASQTTGWRITSDGAADFRYAFLDELHAKSFIADLEQALAGGQIISKSVAMVSRAFEVPDAGNADTLYVRDLPSAIGMAAFEDGDLVVLRTFSRADGSLTIGIAVGAVSDYVDEEDGEQSWTWTRLSGASGGSLDGGTIIAVDSLALDYGVSGNGYYEVSAVDGAYGANAPYAQVVTWATSPTPSNRTVRARFGKLTGITSTADEFGLLAGTYASTNGQYFRASNSAFELHGIDLTLWDGSDPVIALRRNSGSPYFALGATLPTAYGTGTGVWMGDDSGTYKFRVGNPSGVQVAWNGSTVTVGDTSNEHVAISGTAVQIKDGATVYADLSGGALALGDTSGLFTRITSTALGFNSATSLQGYIRAKSSITVDAISHASTVSSASNTLGISHTTGGGSNRFLIAAFVLRRNNGAGDTGQTLTSVTYGAAPMTLLQASSSTNARVEVWYLVAPATGTDTITATVAGGLTDRFSGGAISYTGVDQSAPLGTAAVGTTGSTQTNSASPASAIGDVVVAFHGKGTSGVAVTINSESDLLWTEEPTGGANPAARMTMTASTQEGRYSSTTSTFSWTGSVTNAMVSVAIKPSGFSGSEIRLGQKVASQARTEIDATSWRLISRSSAGVDTTRIQMLADGSGYVASSNLAWTSAGVLTAGGWTIGATSITDTAGVVGLSSAVTGGDDIRIWAGNATPASASFRVTEAGAVTATSATVTGVITANTGYIGGTGGWVIATGEIGATNAKLVSNGTTGYVSFGATPPTGYGNNVGAWLGYASGAKMSLYADASNYLQWDASKLLVKAANFTLDSSGNITAANATLTSATVSGSVTATTGAIGGFTLASNKLSAGTDADYVALISDGTNAIQIGDSTFADAKFSVTAAGLVKAISGSIGGWALGASSLTGGDAVLSSSGNLSLGTGDDIVRLSADDSTYRLWIGDATAADADFSVTKAGVASMTGAVITGPDITLGAPSSFTASSALKYQRATGGNFGGASDRLGIHALSSASAVAEYLDIENILSTDSTGGNGFTRIKWITSGWQSSGNSAAPTASFAIESIPGQSYASLTVNNGFAITAPDGVTVSAGLSADGDFAVATDKFTVASASGNTAIDGTIHAPNLGSDTGSGLGLSGSGEIVINTSSRRFKRNLRAWSPSRAQLDAFMALPPTLFDRPEPEGATDVLGFIAEDAQDVPYLLNWDRNGQPFSFRDSALFAYMHATIRELTARVAVLEAA